MDRKKTKVTCFLYKNIQERGTHNFQKKAALFFKRSEIFGSVIVYEVKIERNQELQCYVESISLEINEQLIKLDQLSENKKIIETTKQKRVLFLQIIENQIENLKQQIKN
jgi:hypothetical protein